MQESVVYASPAAPAANGTAVLFNSILAFNGAKMMRMAGLTMVEVTFLRLSHDSAANGLIAYASTDGGTNWRKMSFPDSGGTATMPLTVSALAADTNKTYTFDVSGCVDFKLEHTNSNNTLTAWELMVVGHFGAAAVQK